MTREELLNSRGFRDEEHLAEFLDKCVDESWKQDLIEYFGDTPKSNKKSNKKSKEVEEVIEEEVIEEEIPEETESEIIEEASEEEINEEE